MKPTGKTNPITGDEIMQAEVGDINWEKEWSEMALEDKANYLSYKGIGFLNRDVEERVAFYYKLDRDKYL